MCSPPRRGYRRRLRLDRARPGSVSPRASQPRSSGPDAPDGAPQGPEEGSGSDAGGVCERGLFGFPTDFQIEAPQVVVTDLPHVFQRLRYAPCKFIAGQEYVPQLGQAG